MTEATSQPPGPGVDAQGRAVIDPTVNVIALNEAANKRQDDLREMSIQHIQETLRMHIDHAKELRGADKELRQAESDRLDAIRAVDVQNVQTATTAAEARASVLAQQVVTTADAFRTALSSALEPYGTNIETLRQSMFILQGERAKTTESRGTSQWAIAAAIAAVGVMVAGFLGALTVGVALYATFHH
jgi:hypothetical protein